jgi:hypothetical protein
MIIETVAWGEVALLRNDDGSVSFTDKDGVTRTITDPDALALIDTVKALRGQGWPITRIEA